MPAAAPFGLWPSPISPKMISQSQRLSDCAWDSDGQTLVWLEGRGDRGVLVASQLDGDAPRDLTDELSVRARVGYGGGDFCVGGGKVVFASGGRLYVQMLSGGKAKAITPAFGQVASPTLSPDGKWVLFVHNHDRVDCLAMVDVDGKFWPQRVATGRDFYMQARWSPDGKRIAFVAWDHPHMPWISSRVYLADVRPIAGALPILKNLEALSPDGECAAFQPEFSPDGSHLSWLCDESESDLPLWDGAGNREGWHNIYLHDFSERSPQRITNEKSAQLGSPAWTQGLRSYSWSHDGKAILCVRNERGFSSLWSFPLAVGKKPVMINGLADYTDMLQPTVHPKKPQVALLASGGKQTTRLILQELKGECLTTIVKRSSSEALPPETLVAPQAVTWRSAGGEAVHALLYVPRIEALTSGRKASANAARPPAIVRVHGGPTAQARALYNPEAQFYVTRGYVYLDLNYRGSTGYGRAYMNALRGNWGIVDIEDAVSAAKYLSDENLADPTKLVILGGSAGGFTVLQTLVKHPGVYKAGVCLYGVANQFTLVSDTHKFEEKYSDWLLGTLPEAAAIYRERSPVFHAANIADPLIVFQGDQDEVVPKNQSDEIVASLRKRNVPHEYHIFEGEGHGWRKTETIEKYYTLTEKFLKTHVLFA